MYLISGGYDLLVTIEGKTLVLSAATHFIMKKYKDHGTILGKKETDERMQITP